MTSLISQLNEASDIPLAQLKATMKKDKRVNIVFTKSPQVDEIKDPIEFVKTIRYYLLNNRNVLEFVKSRSAASTRVSNWYLKSTRQVKPENFTQAGLDSIVEVVGDIFRDLTTVTNATISSDTMSSLWHWLGKQAGYRGDLSHTAIREFVTIPSIRPEAPVLLYRGLSFDEKSLEERSDGAGSMTVGSGLRFLRSIRQGKRVADAEWDVCTMWTRDKEAARAEAFSDNRWEQGRQKISGKLGFLVSMLAKPSDIIVDTNMLGPKVKHDPPTVVLKSGKYTIRVVNKWTPDGEVDPTETIDQSSEAAAVAESITMFAHVFKVPFPDPDFIATDRGALGAKGQESFLQLIKPETTTKIIKAYDTVRNYYNEHIKHVTTDELNSMAGDPQYGSAVQVLKDLHDSMEHKVQHPTERDTRYSGDRKKYVPRFEMTGQEAWDGDKSFSLREIIPYIVNFKRMTQWNTTSKINDLAKLAGLPIISNLHQKAGKIQQEQLDAAIAGFFKFIGEPMPENKAAMAHRIAEVVRTAERNAVMLQNLWSIRQSLDRLKD
jgi:hypothetical protein